MEISVQSARDVGIEKSGVTTMDIVVQHETHTLGSMVELHLRRDPDVVSAAYVQDHPLTDAVRFRVTSADPVRSVRKAALSAIAEVEACADACRANGVAMSF